MSEFDAKIYEKVLGRDPTDLAYSRFAPSESVAADYEVLCHVRETWGVVDLSIFTFWVNEIQRLKSHRLKFSTLDPWVNYEPGDYSKAALKALGEDDKRLWERLDELDREQAKGER